MTTTNVPQRNARIAEHLEIVRPISIRFSRRTGHDADDLLQVGMLGLIKAAQRFRNSEGVPFTTFAKPHIRGAILHYLRDNAGMVRLPRRVQEQAQDLIRRPAPKDEQISADQESMLLSYRNKNRWVPLPENLSGELPNSLEIVQQRERASAVRNALTALPKREKEAVQLVILEGRSLRQAGHRLNVSAMTVQRRLKQGLQRLVPALASYQPAA